MTWTEIGWLLALGGSWKAPSEEWLERLMALRKAPTRLFGGWREAQGEGKGGLEVVKWRGEPMERGKPRWPPEAVKVAVAPFCHLDGWAGR